MNSMTLNADAILTSIVYILAGYLLKYLWDSTIRYKEKKDEKAKSFDKKQLEETIKTTMKEELEPIKSQYKEIVARLENDEGQVRLMFNQDMEFYRQTLMHKCKYWLTKGYITKEGFEEIAGIHRIYKAFGGNSDGDLIYDNTMKLDIKTDAEIEKMGDTK